MNGIRSILVRRVGSAFLLMLLFSIQAIKLFHSHSHSFYQPAKDRNENNTILLKSISVVCGICQFECTRETELPDPDIGIRPLAVFSVFNSEPGACFYSVPHFYFFHRGPPTVLKIPS